MAGGFYDFAALFWGWKSSGGEVVPTVPGLEFTVPEGRAHFTATEDRMHFTTPEDRMHFTTPEED